MSENTNFDYEKAKQQILESKNTSEAQKTALLKELAKQVIPPETKKVIDVRISNEIPQKTQDALELAEKMRETLKMKFLEFGLECPELTNLEQVDRATAILRALREKNEPKESPSGSAPLEGQYIKDSGNSKGFESANAMVADLYTRKDPEAKELLDQLWMKAYKGFKDKKSGEFEVVAPEDFLRSCVEKSPEYKKWLAENRRGRE